MYLLFTSRGKHAILEEEQQQHRSHIVEDRGFRKLDGLTAGSNFHNRATSYPSSGSNSVVHRMHVSRSAGSREA